MAGWARNRVRACCGGERPSVLDVTGAPMISFMFACGNVSIRPVDWVDRDQLYLWHCDTGLEILSGWGPRLAKASFETRFRNFLDQPPADRAAFSIEHCGKLTRRVDLYEINLEHRRASLGLFVGDPCGAKASEPPPSALCWTTRLRYRISDRVCAYTYAFNERGRRLMRSAGFTEEGLLRAHEFHNGAVRDMYVYGVLAVELFRARRPSFGCRHEHDRVLAFGEAHAVDEREVPLDGGAAVRPHDSYKPFLKSRGHLAIGAGQCDVPGRAAGTTARDVTRWPRADALVVRRPQHLPVLHPSPLALRPDQVVVEGLRNPGSVAKIGWRTVSTTFAWHKILPTNDRPSKLCSGPGTALKSSALQRFRQVFEVLEPALDRAAYARRTQARPHPWMARPTPPQPLRLRRPPSSLRLEA